jgi:F0F1-type ATP synthase membrane subunit b/b'
MRGFLLLLLWLVVLAQGAVMYWGYEREQVLSSQVAALQEQTQTLQQTLDVQQRQLTAMEQESVSAMVSKANKVIVSGWDAIVDSVESEMVRARAALTELERTGANGSASSAAPADQPQP